MKVFAIKMRFFPHSRRPPLTLVIVSGNTSCPLGTVLDTEFGPRRRLYGLSHTKVFFSILMLIKSEHLRPRERERTDMNLQHS